jgi:hypothetical protein
MMKNVLLFVLALVYAQANLAQAASIADTSWDTRNTDALSAFQKADVAQLFTDVTGFALPVKSTDIGEFTWADLQGNGRMELVATMDVNGRAFFNALFIFWRDSSGKVTTREIDGWMISNLHVVIRDLNGDGRDELIVPTVLVQYNTAETTTWPMVYRLEKGKYIEASREFSAFYDNEVLPKLNSEMSQYQAKATKAGPTNGWNPAWLIMVRDKILRVLGRDPTAGLQQAYQWMNTDDPHLLQDAAVNFHDIGGHKAEADVAASSYRRAICERTPSMVMCRSATQH